MPKLLDGFVAEKGDELALADDRGECTWAELADRVARLGNVLREAGLVPGDTFALMMGNRREAFEAFWAAAHTGVTYVPVNWHWTADELAYVIEDAACRAVIVDERFLDVVDAALGDPRAGSVELALVTGDTDHARLHSYEVALAGASSDEPDEAVMGGPMFYTSGTTGRPKGVRGMLSGGESVPSEVLQLVAGAVSEYVPTPGRTLLAGPVYHSAQWAFGFLPMVSGSSVVMRQRFDPAETVRLIDDAGITNVHLVPVQFKRLLDLPEAVRDQLDGSSLEAVWHGAAPCPRPGSGPCSTGWGPRSTSTTAPPRARSSPASPARSGWPRGGRSAGRCRRWRSWSSARTMSPSPPAKPGPCGSAV